MNEIIKNLSVVRRGIMFIIKAPSGTGKGTVCKELLAQDKDLHFSVSATTRPPRDGEQEGVDYFFLSDEKYDECLAQDAFYEHVESIYGAKYGTLKSEVDCF